MNAFAVPEGHHRAAEHWPHFAPALARAGVGRSFVRRLTDPCPPVLPHGAAEYLQPTNPHLTELIARYRDTTHPGVEHSLWTDAYVARDVPLANFRGETAFMWQHRDLNLPVNYILTYYGLVMDKTVATVLSRLEEDDLFGAYTIDCDGTVLSRDRLDSASEIAYLSTRVPFGSAGYRLLDVGSGYGRLAHRLSQACPQLEVACVDAVARATFLCEYYCRFRQCGKGVQVVPLDRIERYLDSHPVELAVNIHSFSECTVAAVRWWLALLASHHVRFLFIVPNARGDQGLTSTETNGAHLDLLPAIESVGYRMADCRPKYTTPAVQLYGVSPTYYYLFERRI